MQKSKRGQFDIFNASKYCVAVVVAQFNSDITEQLLKSALQCLEQYNVAKKNIEIVRVAGSVEVPLALQKLAKTKKYQCLVALSAIIRGETQHFDYVAKIISEGVLRVQLDYDVPIGFGVLTCDTKALAQERVNAGTHAAKAALHLAHTFDHLA